MLNGLRYKWLSGTPLRQLKSADRYFALRYARYLEGNSWHFCGSKYVSKRIWGEKMCFVHNIPTFCAQHTDFCAQHTDFCAQHTDVLCTTHRRLLTRVTLFATVEQLQFLAAPFLKSETKTKLIYSRQLKAGADTLRIWTQQLKEPNIFVTLYVCLWFTSQ